MRRQGTEMDFADSLVSLLELVYLSYIFGFYFFKVRNLIFRKLLPGNKLKESDYKQHFQRKVQLQKASLTHIFQGLSKHLLQF